MFQMLQKLSLNFTKYAILCDSNVKVFTLELIFRAKVCICFRYGEDSIELGNELVKMVGVAEALVDVDQQGLYLYL